jgi:polyhydroxybutyrate depolymerase
MFRRIRLYVVATLAVFCIVLAIDAKGICQEKKKVLPEGDSTQLFWVEESERSYFAHVPRGLNRAKKVPLVILLHGGGSQGEGMAKLTKFNDIADKNGFIAVYPDGLEKRWNDGREIPRLAQYDDVAFVKSLIEKLVKTNNVDDKRVYVAGISNGGLMVEKLALEIPEKIAAAAALGAGLTEELYGDYSTDKVTNLLLIFGANDPVVPFAGGKFNNPIMGGKGKVYAAGQCISFWIARNDCASDGDTESVEPKVASDQTRIRKTVYSANKGGKEVEILVVDGGGHTWPSGPQYLPEKKIGLVTHQLSNEDIWAFFQNKHL